jgi:threonine dehydrogenase-like Zn-dependent dehydrogenase
MSPAARSSRAAPGAVASRAGIGSSCLTSPAAACATTAGAPQIIGAETQQARLGLARRLGLFDAVIEAGPEMVSRVRDLTGGAGVERAFDCSASDEARLACIQATRKWGRVCFLGEGGTSGFRPSEDIIHDQKAIYGSWVTTIWRMEALVERLVRWNIHPETLITHRFTLDQSPRSRNSVQVCCQQSSRLPTRDPPTDGTTSPTPGRPRAGPPQRPPATRTSRA